MLILINHNDSSDINAGKCHFENMGNQITEGYRNGTLSYVRFKRLFLQIFYTKLCVTMVNYMTRILNSLTFMILQTRNMLLMNFSQLSSCK